MFKIAVVLGIVLGASLGALLRWWLSVKFNSFHDNLSLGTLLANVIACFFMGLFLGYEAGESMVHNVVRVAFMTGFLGSLSTFSTFIGETHGHLMIKDWFKLLLGFNLQIGMGLLTFHYAKLLGHYWQG
ncbi:MAG: CrcB family protein [Oceanospirillaceae bacterium]